MQSLISTKDLSSTHLFSDTVNINSDKYRALFFKNYIIAKRRSNILPGTLFPTGFKSQNLSIDLYAESFIYWINAVQRQILSTYCVPGTMSGPEQLNP